MNSKSKVTFQFQRRKAIEDDVVVVLVLVFLFVVHGPARGSVGVAAAWSLGGNWQP